MMNPTEGEQEYNSFIDKTKEDYLKGEPSETYKRDVALQHLDDFVEEEINRLESEGLGLHDFPFEELDSLQFQYIGTIRKSILQLRSPAGIRLFCRTRGIDCSIK